MENQNSMMADYYTKAMKTWSDMFKYQPQKAGVFFQPLNITDLNKRASKGVTSTLEIYDAWLTGMDKLIDESCEISRKMLRGEEIETEKLSEIFKEEYNNINSSILKSLEETPFECLKEMDSAIRNSMNSFSGEQEVFKEILNEMMTFRSKMIKLFKLSNGDFSQMYSNMLKGKPVFSDDNTQQIIEMYRRMIEHSADMLRILAVLNPACKSQVNETIGWAKKSAGIFASWMELTLKPYKEWGKYTMDFYAIVEETLKEGNSIEEFYSKWVETMDKAKEKFVKNPSYYESISEFINKNTDFIKTTMELYRNSNPIINAANGYSKSSDESESLSMQAA